MLTIFFKEREREKKEEENLGFRVFSRKAVKLMERGTNKQKIQKNVITFKACANVCLLYTYVVKESRREEEERDITHAQRVEAIYIYNKNENASVAIGGSAVNAEQE